MSPYVSEYLCLKVSTYVLSTRPPLYLGAPIINPCLLSAEISLMKIGFMEVTAPGVLYMCETQQAIEKAHTSE